MTNIVQNIGVENAGLENERWKTGVEDVELEKKEVPHSSKM